MPALAAAWTHSLGSGLRCAKAALAGGMVASSSLVGTGAGCSWVSIARSRSTTIETVTGECQPVNRRE